MSFSGLADLARASALAGLASVSAAPEPDACALKIEVLEGQLAWHRCFPDTATARKLLKRLQRSDIPAEIVGVGDRRGVRYRPLAVSEALEKGKAALRGKPGSKDGLYEVSVDWDAALRSFVYAIEASCPQGWEDAGEFSLSAYVIAQESEFPDGALVESPCGLEGATFREAFLFGDGVRLQGTGLSLDGQYVRYAGKGCFAMAQCPRTALGGCAKPGHTVAVDPTVVPLGSQLLIEGLGARRAEDTGGGVEGKQIDVFYGTELTMTQARSKVGESRRVCMKAPVRGG